MSTFETMGTAQLLAIDGQRAIAAAIGRALKNGLERILLQMSARLWP